MIIEGRTQQHSVFYYAVCLDGGNTFVSDYGRDSIVWRVLFCCALRCCAEVSTHEYGWAGIQLLRVQWRLA